MPENIHVIVNVFGMLRVTKNCLSLLRPSKIEGGRIVNVSSLAGRIATPGITVYCMAKHCVRVLSDAIRREGYLADSSVQVVTIEPSFYQTAMLNRQSLLPNRKGIWNETPDSIKEAYKEETMNDQLDLIEELANLVAHSNVDEMTDAMMRAVTLKHPKLYYRCCGWVELPLWAFSHLPEVLINLTLHLMLQKQWIKSLKISLFPRK